MGYLSRSIADVKAHYTIVIVGSGYGGAVAAARLAEAGIEVCVLAINAQPLEKVKLAIQAHHRPIPA